MAHAAPQSSARSEADGLQKLFWIALTLDRDRSGGALDLGEIAFRQHDVGSRRCSPRGDEAWWCRGSARSTASAPAARQARSAPASRPSRRRCASTDRSATWFFSIASGVKRGRILRKSPSPSLVSLLMAPVRKPLPSGLYGDKADAEFFARFEDAVGLRAARPERVLVLQRGDRLNLDGRGAGFSRLVRTCRSA